MKPVACVDAQGGRSVELAKALLPQVRLLVAVDGTSVGAELKKVEEMVWKQQRRKLQARPSETTSQLARLAATLPSAPVLSGLEDEPKTEFEYLLHFEPSEEPIRDGSVAESAAQALLPDGVSLALQSAASGVVSAPSMFVPGRASQAALSGFCCTTVGELGLYACKPFEKGEVVCQAQSPWQALPLAELQSTERALVIRQIRDQLGRTKQYVLRGWNKNTLTARNSRFMCVMIHVTSLPLARQYTSRPKQANLVLERSRTAVQWVAAHRIEAGDECLWRFGLYASLADT